jgi:putative endonuclease
MATYWVYILSSASRVLYVGVTNALERRTQEHRDKAAPSFTCRYNVDRLVYFEQFRDVRDAIAREKQLKGWRRAKKLSLIEQANPAWADLGEGTEAARATAKTTTEAARRGPSLPPR